MPPILAATHQSTPPPDPFAGLERFVGHAAGDLVALGIVLLAVAALLAGYAPRHVAEELLTILGPLGAASLVLGACFAAAPGPANFDAVWRLAHWASYAGIAIAGAVLTRRVYRSRRAGARSWR